MNSERLQKKLKSRLKGYHRTYRGKFLFLIKSVLNEEEYILWDFSFSVLADWDKKNHPDEYGTFIYRMSDIDTMLRWGSSKTCRLSKKLFEIGLWKKESERIRVCGYEIVENLTQITKESGIVDLQEYLAKTHSEVVNLQDTDSKEIGSNQSQTIVNLQSTYTKELLSLSSKFSSNKGVRTDEEYREIMKSGNYKTLTIDDMKWIDTTLDFKEKSHYY